MWYATFDGTFWITMAGLIFGFLGIIVKMAYRSKCKEMSCLCFKIVRDTENEIELDELAIQNNQTSSKDEKENNV